MAQNDIPQQSTDKTSISTNPSPFVLQQDTVLVPAASYSAVTGGYQYDGNIAIPSQYIDTTVGYPEVDLYYFRYGSGAITGVFKCPFSTITPSPIAITEFVSYYFLEEVGGRGQTFFRIYFSHFRSTQPSTTQGFSYIIKTSSINYPQ